MLKVYAPADGLLTPIEQVPDAVFNERMLGDGVAVAPASNLLCSPIEGKILNINKNAHAVAVGKDGLEILLHIGVETVQLQGEGFHVLVKEGAHVTPGQPLIEFDPKIIRQQAVSDLIIMVVTAPADVTLQYAPFLPVRAGEDLAFTVCELHGNDMTEEFSSVKVNSRTLTIANPNGLHARPAGTLAKMAEAYPFPIFLHKGDTQSNAKSVVGLMGLSLSKGDHVFFSALSEDQKTAGAALERLAAALEIGLGEDLDELPLSSEAQPLVCKENPNLKGDKSPIFKALTASIGIVHGNAFHFETGNIQFDENAKDSALETKRLNQALHSLEEVLRSEITAAKSESSKEILKAHLGILKDPFLENHANSFIAQGKSAEFAFNEAIRSSIDTIKRTKNRFLMERISDFKDLRKRVLLKLSGKPVSVPQFPKGSILLCEDLLPSDLAVLNENVKGVILAQSSPTAHSSIMLRNMGLPALVSAGECILGITDGARLVLDATEGLIYVNPSEEKLKELQEKIKQVLADHQKAQQESRHPAVTKDEQRIIVGGNISNEKEALLAYQNGAESLGLVRTEFLFFQGQKPPSEERQFMLYQNIANAMHGQPITLRTLDVGGDKPVEYINIPHESNPIVGLRGVRNYHANQEVFLSQIRAMLRVQPPGTVKIMLPMITFVNEIIEYRQIIEAERKKLSIKTPVEIGIMVEVPSAALMSEQFAKHADFLSIGTNDLTQYALAIDRGHKTISYLADCLNPAVLKLIYLTCQGAQKHQKKVAVCGAMAGDPQAVPLLIGLGVTELAVAGNSVAQVKAIIRELDAKHCRETALKTLELAGADEVHELVKKEFNL